MIEHIALFPAPNGKCSGLLTDQLLKDCVIYWYMYDGIVKNHKLGILHQRDIPWVSKMFYIFYTNFVSTFNSKGERVKEFPLKTQIPT